MVLQAKYMEQDNRINMENKRKYKEYWKINLDYDLREEIRIYRYLCGQRMLKKPEEQKRFVRKKSWEEYVYSKYKEQEKGLLHEFLGFLSLQKRNRETMQGINIGLYFPITVAAITSLLVPEYFENEKLIIFSLVFFIMFKSINKVWNQGEEVLFLEDYIKIITSVIEEG